MMLSINTTVTPNINGTDIRTQDRSSQRVTSNCAMPALKSGQKASAKPSRLCAQQLAQNPAMPLLLRTHPGAAGLGLFHIHVAVRRLLRNLPLDRVIEGAARQGQKRFVEAVGEPVVDVIVIVRDLAVSADHLG